MRRPTILVADDDPAVLDLLERLLPTPWRLLRARDGREALEIARSEQPAVVLLDLRMPAVGGIEVTRRLRASAEGGIPIFIFSSEEERESRVLALAAGARAFLSKPITRRVLEDLLAGLEGPDGGTPPPHAAPEGK